MKKSEITKIKGISEGTWVWCLHCERCYQAGEYREIRGQEMCPYPDCDGDTVLDSWTWESIREIHPDYPEVPQREKMYTQFG
jgi:hypothetical protein